MISFLDLFYNYEKIIYILVLIIIRKRNYEMRFQGIMILLIHYLAILYLKYFPLCHERNQLPKIDCDILSHVRLAPQLLQFRENLRRLRSKIVQWPRQIAAVHIP